MTLDDTIPKVNLPEGRKGPWQIERVTIEDNPILRIRERLFKPGTYTHLRHDHRGLVMSDTPAERYDHYRFIQIAQGRVLISGLGLGMCVGALLRKGEVTSVTVLEIDPDVIALVAPHYEDDRLTVIETDALEYKPPKGSRFNYVWHDIWDSICLDNRPQMTKLNRRWTRYADWYGCWSQNLLDHSRGGW